ncbi:hypothetical protein L1887_58201 [Cichorium endivia]|nr:hypothetical protein L1887_58201 [Cichorium endivia]
MPGTPTTIPALLASAPAQATSSSPTTTFTDALTAQDLATRVRGLRAQAQPGHLALANQLGRRRRDGGLVEGHVEPLRWISGRWRGGVPLSIRPRCSTFSTEEQQRAAKRGVRFQRVEELRQVLRRLLFSGRSRRRVLPTTGWGFYSAVERGVLPAASGEQNPHRGQRKSVQELEAARQAAQGCSARKPRQLLGSAERRPLRALALFSDGYSLAWTDSVEFLKANESNEIGFHRSMADDQDRCSRSGQGVRAAQ